MLILCAFSKSCSRHSGTSIAKLRIHLTKESLAFIVDDTIDAARRCRVFEISVVSNMNVPVDEYRGEWMQSMNATCRMFKYLVIRNPEGLSQSMQSRYQLTETPRIQREETLLWIGVICATAVFALGHNCRTQ